MRRYTTPTGSEGEYEPGSRRRVLRNLMGIRSAATMNEVEAEALSAIQQTYYFGELISQETCFTAALIRQMHRDWLGGIYEWAGRYRTVEMSKAGFAFPPAYLTEQNMARLESEALARLTPCKPGPIDSVCLAIAEVHAELLLIHPFRDGNGRVARWLANLMAIQAGLPTPAYGFAGRGSQVRSQEYLAAVLRGYGGAYSDLAGFFRRAIELKLAAERSLASERGEAPSNTDDS